MTFRQQAEQIVFSARNLREDDAVAAIECELRLLYIKGQRSGIEEARQRLTEPMEAAE